MPNKRESPSGILVLHKTLDILETIRESATGVSLADLARALGIPKPTAYRITTTLESRGYLARNESGRYQMTRKFFDLESKVASEEILVRAAMPLMERLGASCRETLNLGILDAGEVVVICSIESPQAIRMSSKVGNRRYLHSTALGKVLLSGLPEKDVLRLLRIKKLPRLTPSTIVSQTAIMAEIEQVRKKGYAMDNEENEPGGRCIGAPIAGIGGRVVAALSLSAPSFRVDVDQALKLVPELANTCRAISKAIAPRPEYS